MEQLIQYYTETATANVAQVERGSSTATKYVDWVVTKAREEAERAKACLWRGTDIEVDPVVKRVAGEAMAERIIRRGE